MQETRGLVPDTGRRTMDLGSRLAVKRNEDVRAEVAAVRPLGAGHRPPWWLLACSRRGWTLAALLVVLAVPASASAQAAGTIRTGGSTINIAQCTGSASDPELDRQETLTVGLSWTVALDAATPQFTTGGVYRIYVANEQPAAGQGTNASCTQPSSSSSTHFLAQQLGSDISASSQTTATRTYSLQEIVSLAGLNCTDPATATVYLCVQWFSAGGTADGWANGTLTLDRTSPAVPTALHARPGDCTLYLDCAAGDGGTVAYEARATSQADGSTHYSAVEAGCGDLKIDGLVNAQSYSVVVFGFDAAGNHSAASAAVLATPIQSDDFWTHYHNQGGRDAGGCSSEAAPGLLGALALLRLRRRRP